VSTSGRGTTTITTCSISGNSAANGGGLYNDGNLMLTGGTVASNLASGNGGAVSTGGRGTTTITTCSITGNSASSGGGVYNDGTFTLSGATVASNSASMSGGGVYTGKRGTTTITTCGITANSAAYGGGVENDGTAAFLSCTVTGNNSANAGGGISEQGLTDSLTLTYCSISGNTATNGTGGGITTSSSGTVALLDCSVSGNTSVAGGGGGIWDYDTHITLSNCTVSGNIAGTLGGGVGIRLGDLRLSSTTVSANFANYGGGIAQEPSASGYNYAGALSLANSIVAGNRAKSAADVGGQITTDSGHNMFGAALQGTTSGTGDIFTNAPMLGPLGHFGGPTTTVALETGSPAIGTGVSSGTTTDQRGFALGSTVDIGAFQSSPLVVNSTASGEVTAPGLLDLLQAFNLACLPGAGPITFDPTVFTAPQTISLTAGQIELTSGSPTLINPGPQLTISAGGASRVFQIDKGVTATMSGLAITGGIAGRGGGILNYGTLKLTDCTISGNSASDGGGLCNDYGSMTLSGVTVSGNTASDQGAGVFNNQRGTTTITTCSISGNHAPNGAGIANYGTLTLTSSTLTGNIAGSGGAILAGGGSLSLANCTIVGNNAGINGGGIESRSNITVLASTFSGNTASSGSGGAIDNFNGQYAITIEDSILSNDSSPSGPEVSGAVTSLGHNLVSETNGSSGWAGSDLTGTSSRPLGALLGSLGDYGGPLPTIPLLPGSPAIGTGVVANYPGTTTPITTDERGAPRGSVVDIGAFQSSLVVESTSQSVVTTAANLTLTGAVELANQFAGLAIGFDPAIFGGPQTITLSAPLDLSNTLLTTTITGGSTGDVTISGGDAVRVLQVESGVTATVSGLSITGGSTTRDGGGVYNDGGNITLSGVTVTANVASGAGGGVFNTNHGTTTIANSSITGNSAKSGGGFYNDDGTATLGDVTVAGNSAADGGGVYNNGGTTSLTGSTVANNSASGQGGGVCNTNGGTTNITTCTFTGNSAAGAGGAIENSATIALYACTIAGNSGAGGGGLANDAGGSATLEDTIVAANALPGGSPSDIGGGNPSGVVGTYNLVGVGGSGGVAGGTGDIILSSLQNLGLAPLGNYGGFTETMALLPGSVAIGAGTTIPGVPTDQRGDLWGANPDIGAFHSHGFRMSAVPGSTPQVALVSASFTNPLAVTVTPIDPIEPVVGGVVSFSVNPNPNGASANLSAPSAIIGANKVAQVTATANSIIGPYTATASASGFASPTTFNLNNQPQLTFSGIVSQSIAWGTSTATFSGTLANGEGAPVGQDVAVTLAGVTQQAQIGADGSFSTTFDISHFAISTTPYPVSYVYTGDGVMFFGASATSSLLITQATPTISWAAPDDITYGTALSATQLDAAASWIVFGTNETVAGSFAYTPAAGTILRPGSNQTLSVTFTPTDTIDYTTATVTVTINVSQATPTITWAHPANIVYGTALGSTQLDASSSWTVSGVNGTVAGTFTYTPAAGTVLGAGSGQTLAVLFTPSDTTDYTTATARATINVLQATPTISWANPASIVYGTALSGTQLDASSSWTVGGFSGSVAGTFTYNPAAGTVLHAGDDQTLSVVFTPTDTTDYSAAAATVNINVSQVTPTITWANPANIVFGTALGKTQLDASSSWTVGGFSGSVAGTFTYTPAAGSVLGAGADQSLSVLFTPSDTTDYTTATASANINVLQATPTITWANPAEIVYGTALGGSELDASASWTVGGMNGTVAGTFTYATPAGTVVGAGNNQTLSVVFTPTDSTDYSATSASVAINVEKATPDITWNAPASIIYGTPLSATQLDASAAWTVGGVSGSVAGSFTYTPAAGTVLPAGAAQTLSATFTPVDSADYTTASATTAVTVLPNTGPSVTIAGPATGLAGQNLTYTVTATNNGPFPATGVVVTASLPPTPTDVVFVSTSTGVTPDSTGTLTFSPVNLASGTSISYVITLQPTQAAAADSPLVITARVAGNELGTNFNNNTAQISTTIKIPVDLAITQFTATPNTVQTGDDLTYSVSVINNGPFPTTGVAVTSPLGAGARYVTGSGTASPSGTVNLEGSSVVASLGTLAPGASATVTFTAIPSQIATLTGSAVVTSSELNTATDTSKNSATVSTTVVDRVGTIEFSQSSYAVADNAGSAAIVVSRVTGARGTVTVDYTTVAINATPGLDYTPVSGTLTFPNGVSSQTIVVPVLNDPYNDHDERLSVVLSNAQTTESVGQAILGTPNTATLTIQDLHPNHNPLVVTNVQWTGTAQGITQILVTFSKPLISSTAINPANYALAPVVGNGNQGAIAGSGVPLSVAMYRSSKLIVALTPAQPLPVNQFFRLLIQGGTKGGVTDVGDNMLSGNGSTPGTSYAAMLAQGTNLTYRTQTGNLVNLRVTGGGFLDDLLSSTGQGIRLSVFGEVPHHTVLSGSVKKARGGTGLVYLGPSIAGLGRFGDVRVKLTSPPFQIGRYPFSRGSGNSK
jgi:uncharacterized repeat protein (TIGR01451 family)